MIDKDNRDLLDEDTSEEVENDEEEVEYEEVEVEEDESGEEVIDETRVYDAGTDEEVVYEEVEEEEPNGNGPKKDIKKILIPIIIAAIVILAVLIFVILNGGNKKDVTNTPNASTTPSATTETIDWSTYPEIWDERHEINSDYVGEIRFESDLINLPVVQYIDPNDTNVGYDKYLRTDWETMEYDEEGSIFVDPFVDLSSSQNITIYGHYVYPSYEPSMTHKFTPLVQLMEEENYEANKYIYLVLENEVRKYEIAYVYIAQQYDNPLQPLAQGMFYMKTDWTDDELTYYISEVSKIAQYDTGVTIEPGDKFLTLQTCVENRDDQKEIVLAKEVEVFEYR